MDARGFLFVVISFVGLISGEGILLPRRRPTPVPLLPVQNDVQPEQVHLSWDGMGTHMVATWSTMGQAESWVQYGLNAINLNMRVGGSQTRFTSRNLTEQRTQFVHRATLVDLLYSTKYYYRVGDGSNWSDVFYFRSLQDGTNWSPRLAIYGDMGLENAQSLDRLQGLVKNAQIDMIIHVGDMGYDMSDYAGRTGDAFLRMIQPLAAFVPYMTTVGNHEEYSNFTQYKNRFTMPGTENGFYYRFTIGPTNFVAISTEFYFYVQYGIWQIERQYSWLERELAFLNDNRQNAPWIITLGHRPMYCSNDDRDDCTKHESIIRTGLPLLHTWPLEKLFHQNGVDMCIWAHEHSYERMWPVYDRKVYNGSSNPANAYENPGAPVHVISGSAGCKEKTDNFINPEAWSAFRSSDYGFMMMQIHNKTHISVEQVSDDKGGEVIDSLLLIKTKRGTHYQE